MEPGETMRILKQLVQFRDQERELQITLAKFGAAARAGGAMEVR